MTEDPYKDKLYVKKLEATQLSTQENVSIIIEEYVTWVISKLIIIF